MDSWRIWKSFLVVVVKITYPLALCLFSLCVSCFTWHLIRHAVQSTSSSDGSDTHIFCTNCFSSAVSVRLSVGFVRFLHRIHGNSRFPVPGICLNENNRYYIDCQLYAILFTTFTTKINKLCNLFYCEFPIFSVLKILTHCIFKDISTLLNIINIYFYPES